MKQIIMFCSACLFIIACKNSAPESTTATPDLTTTNPAPTTTPELNTATNSTSGQITTTATPATVPATIQQPAVVSQPQPIQKAEPAQNAKGVWHFTCPKGCKGGAGANGPCPKCSTPLVHNQAYHAGENPPVQTVGANPTIPTTTATQPQQNPEPPQNAKGVWHFTCPKGCAGGAGTTAPCSKCGTTLAHNAVYHQ